MRCTHLSHDWLSTRSAVAGATFVNEFVPNAMQAPPLKRRTRQRFTEFDFYDPQNHLHKISFWKQCIVGNTLYLLLVDPWAGSKITWVHMKFMKYNLIEHEWKTTPQMDKNKYTFYNHVPKIKETNSPAKFLNFEWSPNIWCHILSYFYNYI